MLLWEMLVEITPAPKAAAVGCVKLDKCASFRQPEIPTLLW